MIPTVNYLHNQNNSENSKVFEYDPHSQEIEDRMKLLENGVREVQLDKERRLRKIESEYSAATEQMKAEI